MLLDFSPFTLALITVSFTTSAIALYLYRSRRASEEQNARRRVLIRNKLSKEDAHKNGNGTTASDEPKLLIYFGSQTGTAEGFAKAIAEKARNVRLFMMMMTF